MLRLSKKVEYALIALKLFAEHPRDVYTSKQISEKYHIPYELLSKILQKLKKESILNSNLGIHGGYSLRKNAEDISISKVIESIDGDLNLTECHQGKSKDSCTIFENCTIKDPMYKIQNELHSFFNEKKVSDLV